MEEDNKQVEDDKISILAPKVVTLPKEKRKMTEAQLANLKKGQEVRNANRIKRAEEKKKYADELADKKVAIKEREKQKLKEAFGLDKEDLVEEPNIVVKKKKKIVYLPPSDDESEVEEEIIYKKQPKREKEIKQFPPQQPPAKLVFY